MKNNKLNININDEYNKAIFVFYFQLILHFILYFLVSAVEETFFTFMFFLSFLFWFFIYRFLYNSLSQRNYSFWALSFFIFIYFAKTIFYYTFVESHIVILYFSFLGMICLFSNAYIMSSPLFYPRVQWWEYDFRYRGDLKIKLNYENSLQEARLTDLRRSEASIEAFEDMEVDKQCEIELEFEKEIYKILGQIKTKKQIIPGRPLRYGVKISFATPEQKKKFNHLEKLWNEQKQVQIRRKFSDVRNNASE